MIFDVFMAVNVTFLNVGMECLLPPSSWQKCLKAICLCVFCAGPSELDIQEQEIKSSRFLTVRFINTGLKSV